MEEYTDSCPNCDSSLLPEARYCSTCGQQVLAKKLGMSTFLQQFMSDYFTFDSKFFKSVVPLLFKPGFLTSEFFAGRRVRYITPLRLYIFISIVFFLLLSFSGQSDSNDEVDKLINVYFPRLFFLLLPVFAGILNLLHITKEKNYVVHFLFAAHFHAFLFLTGTIYILISELFGSLNLINVNTYVALAFLLAHLTYLFVAIMNVYKEKIGLVIIKFLALIVVYGIILTGASLGILLFLTQGE